MTEHEPDPLPYHYTEAAAGKSWHRLHKKEVEVRLQALFYSLAKKLS